MPKKKGSFRKGKPHGCNYADMLARDRMIKEAVQRSANDARVQVESDIRCQRQLWMCVVALNEQFGFGAERTRKFFEAMETLAEEYETIGKEVDAEYANEKLRQRAEQVSGIKIEYMYESEMRAAKAKHEAEGKGDMFDD